MKLLVIIVTYNAMHWVERCFNSLQQSTVVPDVFVVDNGSTDGTQAYIQNKYPKTIFQQSKINLGFGAANNIGLQYALDNNYDYVYLLNQDAWVMSETFEELIKISKKNPEYGILSPFQLEANCCHLDKNFAQYTCDWNSSHELLADLYNNNTKLVYSVPFVMAAHWFMTKECIVCVGGFSPTFPHYGEDNNYCERVIYHKKKIGIIPSLKVVHDRENRVDDINKLVHFNYTFILKDLSSPFVRHSMPLILVLKRTISAIIHYRTIVPLKNMFRIIINYKRIIKNRKISMSTQCSFLSYKKY